MWVRFLPGALVERDSWFAHRGTMWPMVWQDIVISVCSWAATAALVPSIIGTDKPALWSCIMTTTIVTTFGICYMTLGLLTAAASSWLLALAWLVLTVQQWQRRARS